MVGSSTTGGCLNHSFMHPGSVTRQNSTLCDQPLLCKMERDNDSRLNLPGTLTRRVIRLKLQSLLFVLTHPKVLFF